MTDSIGCMKNRIQLIFRKFIEDQDGNFTEKQTKGSFYWAHVTPMNVLRKKIERSTSMDEWNALEKSFPKKWYFIAMRNYHNRTALQTSLFGVRFNSRLIKLASPFTPSANGKWLEATGFEC